MHSKHSSSWYYSHGNGTLCGQALVLQDINFLASPCKEQFFASLDFNPSSLFVVQHETILLFCGQEKILLIKLKSTFSILFLISLRSPFCTLCVYISVHNPSPCLSLAVQLSLSLFTSPSTIFLFRARSWNHRHCFKLRLDTLQSCRILDRLHYHFRRVQETWSGISLECLKGWKSLMNLAIPSCISVCLEWWWYEIMILLCGLLINPRATVASMGILIQTTALMYIFPSSLSFGVSTRVGNELGANNPKGAKLAAIIGLSSSFVLGFSALLFAVMVRNIWATMFTQDVEIIALTSMVLPIIGLCELGNCPQTTGCGVLRGTARPKLGANINLGCFYLVGTPVAVWLSFYGGYDFKGLWIGLLAAQGSCVVTMLFNLARTNWDHQAHRAKKLMENAAIGHEFEEEEDVTSKIDDHNKDSPV
ncbi:hypothetical protein LWI28_020588 [Acer negundo]|uniref:Multidrug and toxic compound extrusion protein n=1 Tax=Acer negundo TaxID=4023 RepID=A0AAD5IRR5_ACENE|nr:hypothetical protein LWI28_020588 [Acer negundo]